MTYKKAIQDTWLMFDACNLLGIAHAFPEVLKVTRTNNPNTDPIAILWIEKMAELTGHCFTHDESWRASYEFLKQESVRLGIKVP